jgi:hypothetical protein
MRTVVDRDSPDHTAIGRTSDGDYAGSPDDFACAHTPSSLFLNPTISTCRSADAGVKGTCTLAGEDLPQMPVPIHNVRRLMPRLKASDNR